MVESSFAGLTGSSASAAGSVANCRIASVAPVTRASEDRTCWVISAAREALTDSSISTSSA
jgi:hypothetical protein